VQAGLCRLGCADRALLTGLRIAGVIISLHHHVELNAHFVYAITDV
jgi:hypothetical protein